MDDSFADFVEDQTQKAAEEREKAALEEEKKRRQREQEEQAAARAQAAREEEQANARRKAEEKVKTVREESYTVECSQCGHIMESDSPGGTCPFCPVSMVSMIGMTTFLNGKITRKMAWRNDEDGRQIWFQDCQWDENRNFLFAREWDENGIKNGCTETDCIEMSMDYPRAEEENARRKAGVRAAAREEEQRRLQREQKEQAARVARQKEQRRQEVEANARREAEARIEEAKREAERKRLKKENRLKKIAMVVVCFLASFLFVYLYSLLLILDSIDGDDIQEFIKIVKINHLVPGWYYILWEFIANTLPEFLTWVFISSAHIIIPVMLMSVARAIVSKGSTGVKIAKIIGFPIAGGIAGLIAGTILAIVAVIIEDEINILFFVLSAIVVVIADLLAIFKGFSGSD
jgi:cation transport ATPase